MEQGDKTSASEAGERRKFIVIKATPEAIVLRVTCVSTVLGGCFLALVIFHLFSDPDSRRRKDISHELPSHQPLR